MSKGVILRVPGAGPGTGPMLPAAIPALSPDDYVQRWSAIRAPGDVGAAVTAWPSALGDQALTYSQETAGALTVAAINGKRYVKGSGIAAAGTAPKLTSAYTVPRNSTVAAVIRVPYHAMTVIAAGGWLLTRAGDGRWQVQDPGTFGGAGFVTVGAYTSPEAWVVVMFTTPAENPLLRLNASESTTVNDGQVSAGTSPASQLLSITTGTTPNGANARTANVAEVVVWDRLLTATERTAAVAALTAAYPMVGTQTL